MLVSGVSFNPDSIGRMSSRDRSNFISDLIEECTGELVVFPEWSFWPYTPEMRETYLPLDELASKFEWLAACAERHAKVVVVGIPIRQGQDFFNSAFVFSSEGHVPQRYDKRKPFALALEDRTIRSGLSEQVVEVFDRKIHLSICYDLRFFEVFDSSCSPTPFACINLASWPAVRRDTWETLLKARAIELETNFIGVNRYDGRDYALSSKGFDPLGCEIRSESTSILGQWVDTWELRDPDDYEVVGSRCKVRRDD